MMGHPEQLANLAAVTELLRLLDEAGSDPVSLLDVQAHLFQASYRAQQAAGDIRRALARLKDGKDPGWPVTRDRDLAELLDPAWRAQCDPASRIRQDWDAELRVAERIVRQLKAVGDALAWRAFRYDRRVIIALSSNAPPGPFVGKAGLGYELGSVLDHWRDRGTFTLLHDLTSVLRILDCTECLPDGSRMVREVKASPRARASSQLRRAKAALAAIEGASPLPTSDPDAQTCLLRSKVQLKTHVRQLGALIDRTDADGFWIGPVGDRVAGIMNLPVLARMGQDPALQRDDYAGLLDDTIRRHLTGSMHHMRAVSADVAARDPGITPYGIYPLPARHRAGLICDYLIVEAFMGERSLISALEKRGMTTMMLLPQASGTPSPGVNVLQAARGNRQLTLHGAAITQVLLEWIVTDRYAEAISELLDTPEPAVHGILTFSNERAAWK